MISSSSAPTPAKPLAAVPPTCELETAAVPPIRPRDPYAVERYPAARGFVHIVGYDGRGEFMAEFTIPARKWHPGSSARFRRWLIENDDEQTGNERPMLALV